ncbi:MAG: GvpL/GvpF family gas vesicle protein [Pirellulaceae bacterium]|nr:GvpL/GvpF family gas vesicle protein [Pirellulaceae bacterium]
MMGMSDQAGADVDRSYLLHAVLQTREAAALPAIESPHTGSIEYVNLSKLVDTSSIEAPVWAAVSRAGQEYIALPLHQRLSGYSEALSRLHAVVDILPIQYSSLVSERQIENWWLGQQCALRASVVRLRGTTQVEARWLVNLPEVPPEATGGSGKRFVAGGDYLRARRETLHRQQANEVQWERLATDLCRPLPGFRGEHRCSIRPWPNGNSHASSVHGNALFLAGVDCLIDRQQVHAAQEFLRCLRVWGELPTVVSGPWPPFSFVVAEMASSGALSEIKTQVQRGAKAG